MALYVYGLMRADDVRDGLGLRAGERMPAVDVVVHDDIAAVVSEVEGEPVRLKRQALMAHSEVLQQAFGHGPVLPLRFGTVVGDDAELEGELIAPRRAQWTDRLDALAGKGELQLKVTYQEDALLRSILAADPALNRSAQTLRGLPAAASHFERIGLGERINAAIEARRARDTQAIAGSLEALAVATQAGPPQQPTMVFNGSFLVASENFGRFDDTVEALAAERRELMEFKLIGPMPAYSFADRELSTAARAGG